MTVTLNGIKQHRKINSIILYDNPFSLFSFFFSFFWLLFWVNNNKHIHDKNFIIFVNHWSCIDHGNHYGHLRYHWITSMILSIIFSYLPKKKKKSIVLSLTFFFFFWETSPLPNLRAIIQNTATFIRHHQN